MTTLSERQTLQLYEKTGALMRGHFRLTSGLHSDIYLQSALVLQHPEHAGALGAALAAPFRADGVQTVLAPAIALAPDGSNADSSGYDCLICGERIVRFVAARHGNPEDRAGFYQVLTKQGWVGKLPLASSAPSSIGSSSL